MNARLALRSDLLVQVEGEGIAIASDRSEHVLLGSVYSALVPLLDGTRSEAGIREACAAGFGTLPVLTALRRMRLLDLIEERDDQTSASDDAGDRPDAEVPSTGPGQLTALTVGLEFAGDLDPDIWTAAFERHGFRLESDASLRIILTDSYLRPELAGSGGGDGETHWLPVRPVGSEVWIGPMAGPEGDSCFQCVRERLARNRPVEGHLLERLGKAPAALHPPRPSHAVALIVDALSSERPGITGGVRVIDGTSGQVSSHRTLLGPCPHDNGRPQRAVPPEGNPPALEDLLDPLTGVVRELRRIDTGVAGSVEVFEATFRGRPAGPGLDALSRALKTARGKGWTEQSARNSALGEAVERHCAVFRGDEPRRWATLSELGDRGLHPNACQLFSEAQFEHRDDWNRRHRRYNRIPRRFDAGQRCEWSPVTSLTDGRELLLPTALLYDDYPQRDDDAFAWFDPNGTSAGATLEAAELGGLLEVIERDAVAIWWYNRVTRPQVPHQDASFDELCRALKREYWVLDLTTDLGIPVFGAVSRRTDLPTERPLFGFGCHPDPAVALDKSLLEMIQVIALVRDADRGPTGVGLALESWLRTASVDTERFLGPSGQKPSLDFGATVADPLETVRRRVEDAGLDILKLDLTRPDVGIPVVTMIVPGLRSFYARFAPGRLFDVPSTLKWLREPTPENIMGALPFLL